MRQLRSYNVMVHISLVVLCVVCGAQLEKEVCVCVWLLSRGVYVVDGCRASVGRSGGPSLPHAQDNADAEHEDTVAESVVR